MSEPFDPGLQPERTELAWRRTCLAFGIGSLVALRLLPAAFGDAWWTLVGVTGLVASGVMWVLGRRRYLSASHVLHAEGDRARMPGAWPLLVICVMASGAGLVGLGVVATHAGI